MPTTFTAIFFYYPFRYNLFVELFLNILQMLSKVLDQSRTCYNTANGRRNVKFMYMEEQVIPDRFTMESS